MNTLWTGVAYAVLDLIIPTIASVFIFQYPISKLVQTARHFVRLIFRGLIYVLQTIGAPQGVLHEVRGWENPAVDHWQFIWVAVMILIFEGLKPRAAMRLFAPPLSILRSLRR